MSLEVEVPVDSGQAVAGLLGDRESAGAPSTLSERSLADSQAEMGYGTTLQQRFESPSRSSEWTGRRCLQNMVKTLPDQLVAFVARAKDFIVGVQGMVLQETKDWVTEFQNSIAQLDKEVGARLDALKSQIEKATQTQAAAAQPGSIELTVPNADKADGFAFDVLLEGLEGKAAEENITGAKKWVRINVPPGQYKVSIGATVAGKRTNTATAIIVRPQKITKSDVLLPV